jgi:HAD superfamily phosphatase (TIGR01668 family)
MSMAVLENSASPPERVGFIDSITPREIQPSILEVDFAAQAAAGRTTLVLDAESTFVEFDGWDVPEKIIDKLAKARQDGIERIIITSNKRPKTEDDLWQLQWWIEQINADLAIVPLSKEQRKPSPHMLLQAMVEFDVEADNMLMIGDKLTGDVAAANAAGVYSVWVDRLGYADHLGDRSIRRPIERTIARRAFSKTVDSKDLPSVARIYEIDPDNVETAEPRPIDVPDYIAQQGRIAGYGGPTITLGADKLAMIPPRLSDSVVGPIKKALPTMQSERLKNFVAEHGGVMADTFTYSRIALGGLTCMYLIRGNRKAAAVTHALGQATDVIDGFLTRHSNEDPNSEYRIKMGIREANIDKFLSFMTGLGLVINGTKSKEVFLAQLARELTRQPQRAFYGKRGLDTRATRSSKNSTTLLALADQASIMTGPGLVSTDLQYAATAGKYGSSLYSPTEWQRKAEHKAKAERVRELLTNR